MDKYLIHKIKSLEKISFLRNVFLVASGTAGAQAITIAFTPIITRLYGPEAFGLLGVFISILTVLAPISALTYPIAIVLPKEDSEAKSIAKLSVFLAAGLSSIIFFLIIIFGDWFAEIYKAEDIRQYLWLIPFAIIFTALQQVLEQWLIRNKNFKTVARVKLIQSALINSAKAGIGLWHPLVSVLILLQAISGALNSFLIWISCHKKPFFRDPKKNNVNLKWVAYKYKDFPLYRAPQILLNSFSQAFPIFLLAFEFGPEYAGFYVLAKTIISAPINLVSKSVSDVFYPRVTDAINNNNNNNNNNAFFLILKTTLTLALIGSMPFLTLVFTGEYIFSIVFGESWLTAGSYAQWISVWLFFGFINRPSVAAIPVLDLQKWLLIYEVFSTGSKIFSLVVGFFVFGSDLIGIALMSASGVLAYMVLIYKVMRVTHLSGKNEKASGSKAL